jgi:hypothetical protein
MRSGSDVKSRAALSDEWQVDEQKLNGADRADLLICGWAPRLLDTPAEARRARVICARVVAGWDYSAVAERHRKRRFGERKMARKK